MNKTRLGSGAGKLARGAFLLAGALGLATSALAGVTDIAQVPLSTSSSSVVKPNLMYVLDDSGSMAGDYIPDEAPHGSTYVAYGAYLDNSYGSRAAQCNGLAFNPNTVYTLPVTSTGASVAAASVYPPLQTAGLSNINNSFTGPSSVSVISTGTTPTLTLTSNAAVSTVGAQVVLYDGSQNNQSPGNSTWMYGTIASYSPQSSTAQLQQATSSNSGSTYGAWTNVASCTWVTSGTNRTKCQYLAWGAYTNTASCTAHAENGNNSNGQVWTTGVQCQYAATVAVSAASGSGTISSGNLTIGNGTPWVYYTYSGSQTPMSYTYNNGGVITSTTFYNECNSNVGSTPGSGVFTAVNLAPNSVATVPGTSVTLPQSYMNWWAYYHTRIQMMQSSMSLAFSGLNQNYRVGFMKISDPVLNGTGTFLDIADFTSTQKASFYSKVNAAVPNSYTPTRGALARAGQYFANKAPGQKSDPIQYSCQKNYTILSTDGYWNTNDENTSGNASSDYGPYALNNTTQVGEQDGGATPRPMFDGQVTSYTQQTSYLQQRTITPQVTKVVSTLQYQTITPQSIKGTSTLQYQTITPQSIKGTSTLQYQTITPQSIKVTSTLQYQTITPQSIKGTSTLQYQTITPQWIKGTSTLQYQTITPQWIKGTSTLQYQTITPQWIKGTSTLQYQTITPQSIQGTSTLQKATGQLQSRTSNNSGATWTGWSNTGSCTWDTTNPTLTQCQYVWGSFTNTASTCTVAYSTVTTNGTVWSGNGTNCQYSAPVNVTVATSACTAVAPSGGSPYTVISAVTCTSTTPAYGAWTNAVGTCTISATNGCQYAAPVNTTVGSCTPVTASGSSPYTVLSAVTCTTTTPIYGAWTTAVGTCTTSATMGCQYTAPVNTTVGSCAPVTASGSSPYTVLSAVTCTTTTPIYGAWTTAVGTCTTSATMGCQYTAPVNTTVGSCTPVTASGSSPYTVLSAVTCTTTTPIYGAWTTAVGTCTTSATMGCQYTAPVNTTVATSACTAQAASPGSPYTVLSAVTCTSTTPAYGAWTTAVGTCTTSATMGCQYVAGSPVTVATSACTAVSASPGSPYTVLSPVTCTSTTPVYGAWTTAVGTCTTSATMGCQYTAPVNTTVATSACTAQAASPGSPYSVLSAVTCTSTTPVYGAWTTAVGTCTTSATMGCQYTAPVNTTVATSACTAQAASPGSPYSVLSAVTCTSTTPVYGAWTNAVGTCTTGTTMGCRYSAGSAVTVAATACTAVSPSPSSPYSVLSAVTCTPTTPAYGAWTNTASCLPSTTIGCGYSAWGSSTTVATCTPVAQDTTNWSVPVATSCSAPNTSGGTSNAMADVAMYYYQTDLRTSALGNCSVTVNGNTNNVCANNVSPNGTDDAIWQHMTTFTIGLGAGGTLVYRPDYLTASSGDYYNIVQGTENWPTPTADGPTAIDDLWHAAVNGRGHYFSAANPTSVANALSTALASITAVVGYGSAAAASTLEPVVGDNNLFLAKYKSVFWIGDVVSYNIDPVTAAITGPNWSASTQLANAVSTGTPPAAASAVTGNAAAGAPPRNIFYFNRTSGGNTGTLHRFTYANLTADGLNGNVDNACTKTVPLTQCSTSGFATATANSGANMVSWLIGGTNAVYRARTTTDTDIPGGILGDIIGGAPVYVHTPSFKYTENNYAGFVSGAAGSRPGVVYVGSNDGMLHAIDGATGNEKWAYIPSMVMPNLYLLADNSYATLHQFTVNGAPVVGDIYAGGAWKTILVGGLGAGGVGYYALDITDPNNPKALWEFANDSYGGNSNLGLTFGNPIITKRADGTWVVAFSSGYNNTSGDGNGHLFMVNANTGQRVLDSGGNPLDIKTYTSTGPNVAAGTAATPSGLGKINAWVTSEIDNTALRYYGGDLLGNVWRFDVDNVVAPNQAALRLAYLQDSLGNAQPITTEPIVANVTYAGTSYPVVYVATGKYLGTTDLNTTGIQSVYALKDPLTNTSLGNAQTNASVVAQTLSQASANANFTITSNAVNWSTKNGWKVNLLAAGERVNVNPQLLYNTLTVVGNIPSTDVCTVGGSSNIYQFDIGNGGADSSFGGGVVGKWLGNTMVVGITWVTLESSAGVAGQGATISIPINSGTGFGTPINNPQPPPPAPGTRRTSWRELVD